MAIALKLKRSETASSAPTTSDIAVGEVAMNLADRILYSRDSSDNIIKVATTDLVNDTTPSLGGNLDVNGNSIVSSSNGNISITPNGTGKVILDGLSHPTADGSAGQFLKTDGSGNLAFASVTQATGNELENLLEDTSPQLGANLDLNGSDITGTGNITTTGDLTLTSTDTGSSAGPLITLVRDSSSPADADYLGRVLFKGEDDGGGSTNYAMISGKIGDASAGSEDGVLEFNTFKGGSGNIVARMNSNGLILNTAMTLKFEGATDNANETTLTVTDPTADRTITLPNASGTVLLTDGDGSSLTGITSATGNELENVSEDTTPQLGGNLDVVTHSIVSTSNRNITLSPHGTGTVVVGTNGIEFSDGTTQTSAGTTQGFAIAMGVALG